MHQFFLEEDCPWCGNPPRQLQVLETICSGGYVYCPQCKACGPLSLEGREGAIRLWNLRPGYGRPSTGKELPSA